MQCCWMPEVPFCNWQSQLKRLTPPLEGNTVSLRSFVLCSTFSERIIIVFCSLPWYLYTDFKLVNLWSGVCTLH